jgi:hypothetical protein
MDSLPIELLDKIFSEVDLSSIPNVLQVSQLWNELSSRHPVPLENEKAWENAGERGDIVSIIQNNRQTDLKLNDAIETGDFSTINYINHQSKLNLIAALKGACRKNNWKVAELLLTNRTVFIDRAFNATCEGGHIEMAKWLLDDIQNTV